MLCTFLLHLKNTNCIYRKDTTYRRSHICLQRGFKSILFIPVFHQQFRPTDFSEEPLPCRCTGDMEVIFAHYQLWYQNGIVSSTFQPYLGLQTSISVEVPGYTDTFSSIYNGKAVLVRKAYIMYNLCNTNNFYKKGLKMDFL